MGIFQAFFHPYTGIRVDLVYQDQTFRLREAQWVNPIAPYPVHLVIWENGSEVWNQFYTDGSGTENLPSNYQLQEVTDPDLGTFLTLPAGIEYQISLQVPLP